MCFVIFRDFEFWTRGICRYDHFETLGIFVRFLNFQIWDRKTLYLINESPIIGPQCLQSIKTIPYNWTSMPPRTWNHGNTGKQHILRTLKPGNPSTLGSECQNPPGGRFSFPPTPLPLDSVKVTVCNFRQTPLTMASKTRTLAPFSGTTCKNDVSRAGTLAPFSATTCKDDVSLSALPEAPVRT